MLSKNIIINSNDINTFKINQNNIGGESGNFLNIFFGFQDNQLILNLIYLIKNIGKLFDNTIILRMIIYIF